MYIINIYNFQSGLICGYHKFLNPGTGAVDRQDWAVLMMMEEKKKLFRFTTEEKSLVNKIK